MRARRIQLPSGLEVRARFAEGARRDDDRVDGEPLRFGRALAALLAPGALERRDGSRWAPLDRGAVLALPMRDFHALRDLLLRTGAIAPEPDDDAACRNCDAPLTFDPRTLDPDALERAHAGAPPPPQGPAPLPAPVRVARGEIAREVTMDAVTIGEARPLLAALTRDEPFRVTPRLLAAMGVRALGSVDRPVLVARALARASDPVWSAVEARYLELNRAPEILAPLHCPACGALHEVRVPYPDELDERGGRGAEPAYDAGEFPSAEAFESIVERLAPAIYEARGVALEAVALRVEPGVPATDIAGEPLLGSYEPRAEGPFDVEREIRDTIDHELEHHLHHLAGHDPTDAAERAEARRELRALYGDRRLARMVLHEAAADAARFARATWPFFAVIAAGIALAAHLGWISL